MLGIVVLIVGAFLAVAVLTLVAKAPGGLAKALVVVLAAAILLASLLISSVRMVGANEVGIVVRHFGGPALKQGRIIATSGENGVQAAVLTPGMHFGYWPGMFDVRTVELTEIMVGQVGLVEARDGQSLPEGQLFAAEITSAELQKLVEDSAYFLGAGNGYRGAQTTVLKPGRYRINTELFKVTAVPQTEVLPGEVAVLTANFGKPASMKVKVESGVASGEAVPVPGREQLELSMADAGEKGIRMKVLTPGKYDLNPSAFKVTDIWTTKMVAQYTREHAGTPVSTPTGVGSSGRGAHSGGAGSSAGSSVLDEREIKVRTSDGFEFPVDVRVEYLVTPDEAPIVVARLGDDEGERFRNALNSAVRATFRNAAENVQALDYVRRRSQQEELALRQLAREMAPFGITVTAVRIGQVYGSAELDKLLATQTEREVTRQELITIGEKQKTAEEQKRLSKTTQEAEEEKRLATAAYAVKIAEEEKRRQIIAANAEAESIRIKAEAQAQAFQVIAMQIGRGNAALVELLKIIGERNIQITPRVMVSNNAAAGAAPNPGAAQPSAETVALIGTMLDSMVTGADEANRPPAAPKRPGTSPGSPAGTPAGTAGGTVGAAPR